MANGLPTKQPPQRQVAMEELQACHERLRYSKEDFESIAGRVREECAILSQGMQSLDLAAAKPWKLRSLTVHHCLLLTESFTAGVQA